MVSVPTGDFSFIYAWEDVIDGEAVTVSVPTGDFSFIYEMRLSMQYYKVVSVPTGDFSFIYGIELVMRHVDGEKSFRPHRGLFFYL